MTSSLLPEIERVVSRERPRARRLSQRFAALVRWLHIYISLFAFAALVFFGMTGITLNHPSWFGAAAPVIDEHTGEIDSRWMNALVTDSEPATAAASDAKLQIVEHLRATHSLKGRLAEFRVDDYECMVGFKGPAYAADAFIDRESKTYRLTVTKMGTVAFINDLHKGRDTGSAWSVMIDVVSFITVFVSVTGLLLIFYIRRKRLTGLVTAMAGLILLVAFAWWFVP